MIFSKIKNFFEDEVTKRYNTVTISSKIEDDNIIEYFIHQKNLNF